MHSRLFRTPSWHAALLLLGASAALADPAAVSVPLGSEYESYAAPEYAGPEADLIISDMGDPQGEIALRQALAAALLRNPVLASSSWQTRVQDALALQAGLPVNPTLGLEVENFAGSGAQEGFEQTETTLSLSLLVQLGGKRAKRHAVADLQGELARWDYEVARIGVLTSTSQAFVAVLVAQRRLELLTEMETLAADAVDSMARQVRAGAAPPVARTRAEVVLLALRLERGQAERMLAASRVALAVSWGSTAPLFERVRGDLAYGVVAPPALVDLERRIDSNPDLARWGTELAERQASLEFANSRAIPDPTLSIGARHFSANDDGALVVSLSLPLPLFDRNQGNALAAAQEIHKAGAQRRSAELAVRSALARRHQDLLAAFEQSQALRDTLLPAAHSAFEGTRAGYRKGVFAYLDVLDAQRTLYELRTRELEALASYHQARADIERLLGAPIDEGGPAR